MTQKKAKNSSKNQQITIIGGIIAVAIIVFAAVLYLASPKTGTLDYASVIAEKDENGDYIRPSDSNAPFITAERTADGAFVIGNPDAAITIVAWEDFLCPHCQAYQSTVKRFIEDYVFTGRARFEFRMLPISTQSGFYFGLVECAAEIADDPAAFWPAHDEMFKLTTASSSSFDRNEFAQAIGVSYSELLDCASDATQYQTDQQLAAQYPDQITGTPAVAWRYNGQLRLDAITRQPSYEQLAALIQSFGQ